MKFLVCLALIAAVSASPMGLEDMMKMMMMEEHKEEKSGGIDGLWGVLAQAHDAGKMAAGKRDEDEDMKNMWDMLELFGGMENEKSEKSGAADISDLFELFGMADAKKSEEKSMEGGLKGLMEMFGAQMEKSSGKDMMAKKMMDREESEMWLEKAFMALLQHRQEAGDAMGVAKMMQWASEWKADKQMVADGKRWSEAEIEEHFGMLFMKVLESRAEKGDYEGMRMLLKMAQEWEENDRMVDMKMMKAEEQMHAIFQSVLRHRIEEGDMEGAKNMMDGALLAAAYDLSDPLSKLSDEDRKGSEAYMLLLQNKAEAGDWHGVLEMMKWGRMWEEKQQMKQAGEQLFYFAHLLLGGDPEMKEWEEKSMKVTAAGSKIEAELAQVMAMMESMGRH